MTVTEPAPPAAPTDAIAARAVNAVKTYGSGDTVVKALDGVNLDIETGRFTAVMGPSGSGKSTLMHCMAGLDDLTSGQVIIGEVDLTELKDKELTILRRDHVGFVFQAFNLVPTLTAEENILLPQSLGGRSPDPEWFDRVIGTVGLGDRLHHTPAELSGGQQQRVAVARALVGRPKLAFADEPTGNLDSNSGTEILAFMRTAVDDLGQTIVMVTHDPVAASYSDRVVFLVDGQITDDMADPTADKVIDKLKHLGADRVFKVALKGVRSRWGRVLTTAIAVMLGVAFVAGTLVLSDTITRVFNDLFADVNAGTDALVRAESTFDDGFGSDIRGRVDQSVLTAVLGTDDVAEAEGEIQGFAQYVDSDGETIGNPGRGAPTLGISWPEIEELNPFVLIDGEPPRGPDQVVMDKATADDGDFAVGDTVTLLTQSPPQDFTIVGIVRFGAADSPGGASVALLDLPTAQALVAEPGKFDAITVVADEGVSQQELVDQLEASLPTDQGLEALTGAEITKETQDAIEQQLSFFTTFLLVFAVIAVIVGAFVIYNTFGILVAQRSRELALFRAIGASRRQVIGSVLVEASFVALVGSVAGLVGGIVLASVLRSTLNALGGGLPDGPLIIEANTIVVGLLLGFIVTTVAALLPAYRAARIPPVAALRDIAHDSSGQSRVRVLSGLLITIIGGLLLAQGLFVGGDNALLMVGIGAGLVFLGITILGPVLVAPIVAVIGWPVARFRGMTGRLARQNTLRNPKRTSATAAALMIGVGLVGLIAIAAASVSGSIDQAIDESFTGDFVIDSGTFGFGGLSPTLADELNDLPEVDAASGIRFGVGRIGGSGEAMLGLDPETAFDILDVGIVAGSPEGLDENGIAVKQDRAERDGLQIGDPVEVSFAETGDQELEVAMIFADEDGLVQPANYLIGQAAYQANFAEQFDVQVFVNVADGTSVEEARPAIEGVAETYPNAEVQDIEEFKQAQRDQINQFVAIIYVLLMLAVIIALFGIGNTLALSIIERTRELGLLRAVGMTRRQLRSTVRWEAVLTSVFGTLLGLAIGLFFGWAIVEALKDEGLNAFVVPVGQLAIIVLIAGLAGVLAAILPARRAAKLNILDAIAED